MYQYIDAATQDLDKPLDGPEAVNPVSFYIHLGVIMRYEGYF
jgi:hypothetical protein